MKVEAESLSLHSHGQEERKRVGAGKVRSSSPIKEEETRSGPVWIRVLEFCRSKRGVKQTGKESSDSTSW